MARLTLQDIKKSFGTTDVLKGLSLDVEDGEFVSLVGQSGCGKSTLLKIIAGLEAQDDGDVLIDGRPVNDFAPKHRNIAMVFQDYALYPHMTVADNLAMPLVMARLPLHARLPLIRLLSPAHRREKHDIQAQVARVAGQLEIEHLLARKPAQLSGGQRQRVALGRALVRNPQIFLMDEPLSNLDAKLRLQVRAEISELHQSSGLTFVYVTHDQTEAMTMSDRIALMDNGVFLQIGSPNELYADPASRDVARFIGSPEINLLDAAIEDGRLRVGADLWPIMVDRRTGSASLGLRPEAISILNDRGLAQAAYDERHTLLERRFDKRLIEDLGPEVLVHGTLASQPDRNIRIRAQKTSLYDRHSTILTAEELTVAIDLDAIFVFDEAGQRIPVRRADVDLLVQGAA